MVDGAASLMTMTYTLRSAGIWQDERGTNLLDTGAHFYEVYECADGGHFAVGAIEPQFYAELMRLLGLGDEDLSTQMDKSTWPAMKERFAAIFASRTRDEWEKHFAGTDACAAPVLSPGEAPDHPHNVERGTFTEVAGVVQPAPSPRFLATPGEIRYPPPLSRPPRRRGAGRLGGARGPGGRVAFERRHLLTPTSRPGRQGGPGAGRSGGYRLTTGQVTVRMMPSISWIRPTTISPSSSTVVASARAMTS